VRNKEEKSVREYDCAHEIVATHSQLDAFIMSSICILLLFLLCALSTCLSTTISTWEVVVITTNLYI